MLAREDESIDEADAVRSKKQRDLVDHQADVPLQVELYKANAQLEAGKVTVDALVNRQTKIALNAVAVWGELAARRADAELDQWYRDHIGQSVLTDIIAAVQTMPFRPVAKPPNTP